MMATAGSGAAPQDGQTLAVPEGPFIDFCPTTEQIEAHLQQYGFDYKPTVACTEDGVELPAGDDDALTAAESEAQLRAALDGATIGPDKDGDPRTVDLVLADGSGGTIFINADDPKEYEDMTIEEVRRMVFGSEK